MADVSNRKVCIANIKMLEAKTAIRPIPVIVENLLWNFSCNCVSLSAIRSLLRVLQINNEEIILPRTIVSPTNHGNLATASG